MVSLDLHARPLLPGTSLGPYTLFTLIARGGMGEVWLARGPEGAVAVKAILPAAARDPAMRALFHEETRIAGRIADANVVRLLHHGEADGSLYYAMEWVDGASLAELLDAWRRRGDAVDRGVILRLALDASRGLHAAHELVDEDGHALDVVHRDVAPENLLIAADGGVKVSDFGVARARGRRARATTTGKFRGRFAYAAPEQRLGKPTDRRADVYALAAVICEALASDAAPPSEPALERDESLAVFSIDAQGLVFDPPVPPPLMAVLRRALARHRDARYATARDFGAALEAACPEEIASRARVAEVLSLTLGEDLSARRRALEGALVSTRSARTKQPRRRYALFVAATAIAAIGAPRLFASGAASAASRGAASAHAEPPVAVPAPARSILPAIDRATVAPPGQGLAASPHAPSPPSKARATAPVDRPARGAITAPIREDDPGF